MSWDVERICRVINGFVLDADVRDPALALARRLGHLVVKDLIDIPEPLLMCSDNHIEFEWDHVPELSLGLMWTPDEGDGRKLHIIYQDEHIRIVRDPTDEQLIKYLRRLVPGDE